MPVSADRSEPVDSKRRPGSVAKGSLGRRPLKANRLKPKPKAAPLKPDPDKSSLLGSRIITGVENLLATMKNGGLGAVEKKFTVRKVKKATFEKPVLGKKDVLAIRMTLGASQSVFANLLGVSVATVRAWEQGANEPSGIAIRFLVEVRANPDYWKKRLREAATA
jgi:putative transcriptional regulator